MEATSVMAKRTTNGKPAGKAPRLERSMNHGNLVLTGRAQPRSRYQLKRLGRLPQLAAAA